MKKICITIAITFIIVLVFWMVYNSAFFQRVLNPISYKELIFKYSDKYEIDPYLVASIISVESNFDPNARSHKDALGLMQITSPTAIWIAHKIDYKQFSEKMLFDPEINIMFGCWYIDNLREEFGDNLRNILAAYNGGRGNVNKWLSDKNYSNDGISLNRIPFKETDNYVHKVIDKYNKYKNIYK
ncbi:MAG: lytic transglycosylase domain-containing protein [Clostridia bacterium]|nr:lytic transglycosylase domain-containing protein [Clostridia bacterium]